MATIRQPEVTAQIIADSVSPGVTEEKLLVVGTMISGTATAGDLQTNIGIAGEEDALFGAQSPIAAVLRRTRLVNKATRIDAIGLETAGGGAAAAGNITFTGTATAAGTITVYVGSKRFNVYTIAVAIGDTATVVGDALVTAMTADANAVATAVNTTGSVALTAATTGVVGNDYGIRFEGSAVGITVATTAFSGGSGIPVLTTALDVVGSDRYQGIVWEYTSDISTVRDFLDARFNTSNNVLDGRAFMSISDTYANHLVTLAAQNSHEVCILTDRLISKTNHKGASLLDLASVKAGEFAAIRALRRTEDAALGQFVIARNAGDSFGGIHTNSKPYFNTPFVYLDVPDGADSFTDQEIEDLLAAGGFVAGPNMARTGVITGEVVTTYKTNAAGSPDPTFTFLNYVDTATAAREFIANNTRARYAQYRASSGALQPDIDNANEASVKAFVIEQYADLGDEGLVNIGVGTINGVATDFDQAFRDSLTVVLNPVTGRFSINCKLFIVTQFRAALFGLVIAFEV